MVIKHIVLSGGAQYGISLLSALYESEVLKVIEYNNIEKLYATSAGTIALTVWLLRMNKDDIYNFFINRPWDKAFKFEENMIYNLFNKNGIVNKEIIITILEPLFKTISLSIDITLKEFYEYTKKEIHIVATKVSTLEYIDFNYKDYPDLSLIEAIYMSSTIPCIMQPIIFDNNIIVDGGVGYNYPITLCKNENTDEEKNILGIKMSREKEEIDYQELDLIKYILKIIENMKDKLNKLNETQASKEILIKCDNFIKNFPEFLISKDKRNEIWEIGKKAVKMYLEDSIEKIN